MQHKHLWFWYQDTGSTALKVVGMLALFLATSHCAQAQSLNEKLISEDPAKLAQQARKNGDIVRGAILFHQGNTNCAKCHRPNAEKDRIGPDLSRIEQNATDKFLIESILQPSKTIKKGFETVTVLTIDGQTIDGLVVSDDDQKIVIRDSQNVDKLITIDRDDLEQMRPGTQSNMPDNLANELKNRQQFLDLLRYVIDVKERGPTTDTFTTNSVRRELSPELKGLVLLKKLNCAACHELDPIQSVGAAKQSPNLNWSAKWLNPAYMESFVANPHHVKPGTSMPSAFGNVDPKTRQESARAIVHFLATKNKNQFAFEPIEAAAVADGHALFHSVGCVACHSPRDKNAIEQPLVDSQPLGDLSNKYNVGGLVSFLEDPHAVRPSGHMPNMQLTRREAIEISNFLLQSAKPPSAPWQPDLQLADQGKALFLKNNCASCHSNAVDETVEPASQLTIGQLDTNKGCLSNQPGACPDFQLAETDRQFIRQALAKNPIQLDIDQQIDVSLTSFNCLACHDRNSLGGVTSDRNPHFQTTNLNLGDQGRIPPTLTGVGAKLNAKWMRDVLVNQRKIRPYMKTRMPQYGEDNIGHLVNLFQSKDRLSETKFAEFKDQKEMRKRGLELAGSKGLNCVACHTYKYKLSDTMPAVDLTEMADRLKKDWFYQYMLNPQKFSPNTVMPSFWPEGKAIRKDLAGIPEEQVEALWQYLIDGRQAGTPRGVVREPLEIIVAHEAKMLRRSYPGIGKRGIGVGYPGGINLAFDAEQLRLSNVWKGKFADPAGVWTGQGSGTVRAMGRTIDFAKGPELDSLVHPWVVDDGRPPQHQFKGYQLDKLQRPTFRYSFQSVYVEDYFSESASKPNTALHLRRTLSLISNEQQDLLRFRIASADKIAPGEGNTFSVGERLKVRVVSEHVAEIIDGTNGKQLQVPLKLAPQEKQQLVIEYLWE